MILAAGGRPRWRASGEKPLLASTSSATPSPERLAHGGHDLLGAARPFVDVVAAFGADAELEGVVAVPVAQAASRRSASSSGVMSRFIDEA